MSDSGGVVDFEVAKKRIEIVRKVQKEKDLERRFKKAIGWKEAVKFKTKKKPKGKGRRR